MLTDQERFKKMNIGRKIDSIAEIAWQLNQRSETKSQNLEHDWDVLMALAREIGWSKDETNIDPQ